MTVEPGEFCAVVGPVGVRQVHHADAGGRPRPAQRGHGDGRRAAGRRHRGAAPASCSRPTRCCRGRPCSATWRWGRCSAACRRRTRGPTRVSGCAWSGSPGFENHHPHQLSGGMRKRVGAGRGADQRAVDPADGRAVRRARRADQGDHVQRAADAVGPDQAVGHLRHARPGGGDRARRPGGGDDRRARAPSRRSSTSTCPGRAARCRRSGSASGSPSCTTRSGSRCATR